MRLWLSLFLLLVALPVLAADGDRYTGGTTFTEPAWAILICDSKTATGACYGGNGFTSPSGYKRGAVNFEVVHDTGCTAYTVEIRMASSSTATQHVLYTLSAANSSRTLQAGLGIAGKLYAEVMTEADCTDLDIAVHYGRE